MSAADCCVARPYVDVLLGSQTLRFCGHHYARHEAALRSAGATVTKDERLQNRHEETR